MSPSKANGNRVSAVAVLASAVVLVCLVSVARAPAQTGNTTYCELQLTGCPQDYDGKELVVPMNVIALSTQIDACAITTETVVEGGAAPAVMFVIDHSYSMVAGGGAGGDANGNDGNGNRFRVTRALIDTIYKSYPGAEVGVVVFADGLVFDATRDNNLAQFMGPTPTESGNPIQVGGVGGGGATVPRITANQSYMPLLPLDSRIRSGGESPFYTDGVRADTFAIDLYRSMFRVPASQNQRATINGGPTERSGTDISIGFEAALEAFSRTNKPKESQYIIFLSDGEATVTGCTGANVTNPRCPRLDNYIQAANTPTTYTVFLDSRGTRAPEPPTISQMTNNVKVNGYSSINETSDYWVLESNYNALLTLMMENIITPMLSKTNGTARTVRITSVGLGISDSTGAIDGGFLFSRNLPLDTSVVTDVEMTIKYDVRVDTTFFDANGVQKDSSYILRDHPVPYAFKVRRTANPGNNWQTSQGVVANCGNVPALNLMFKDDTLSQPGKAVKGNMDPLTIVFDNYGGLFNYGASITVQVSNTDETVSDLEDVVLRRVGNTNLYSGEFRHVVSEVAGKGNQLLEHAAPDSIVVFFRNPSIPLDTIRIAVPYVSNEMAFYDKPGNPNDGRPMGDKIDVKAGDTTNIFAKIFDDVGKWDPVMTSDSNKITWTISGGSGGTLLGSKKGEKGVFYSEIAGGTYTVTAEYRDGPMVIRQTITVTVVHGDPYYLEVVFDSSKINTGKKDPKLLEGNKKFEFTKGKTDTTFYAVLRDKFGNYIGPAVGSGWDSNSGSVTTRPVGTMWSAEINRGGTFGDGVYVIVTNGGLVDSVKISVVGEAAVTVGPNPFVPGESDVRERLNGLDPSGKVLEYYGKILDEGSKGGTVSGGGGAGNSVTGVLVAATSPKSIKRRGPAGPDGKGKYAEASVIIYDAVGNVVYKSKPNDITMAADDTFGFVWNGKNASGRTVGPGTYLVRITATQENGGKFTTQRPVGVTLSGNVR